MYGGRGASDHGRKWAVLFLVCLLCTVLAPLAMADGTTGGGGTPPTSSNDGSSLASAGDGVDAVTTIDTDLVSVVLEKFAIVIQQVM